jgi:hypothetical protein
MSASPVFWQKEYTLRVHTAGRKKGYTLHFHTALLAVKINTPCTPILLGFGNEYTQHVHTSECGYGHTLHVHTAGCGNGYTLQIHTAGCGKGYTMHVYIGGVGNIKKY